MHDPLRIPKIPISQRHGIELRWWVVNELDHIPEVNEIHAKYTNCVDGQGGMWYINTNGHLCGIVDGWDELTYHIPFYDNTRYQTRFEAYQALEFALSRLLMDEEEKLDSIKRQFRECHKVLLEETIQRINKDKLGTKLATEDGIPVVNFDRDALKTMGMGELEESIVPKNPWCQYCGYWPCECPSGS